MGIAYTALAAVTYLVASYITVKSTRLAASQTSVTAAPPRQMLHDMEQQRVAVGPANAHCTTICQVSLRAAVAGNVLWQAAAAAPAATAALLLLLLLRQFSD